MKNKNCISTTGCVHAVKSNVGIKITTLCNLFNYLKGDKGDWLLTDKPVTCKNCLAVMDKIKYSDKEILDFIQNIIDNGNDFVLEAQCEESLEDDENDNVMLSMFTPGTQWVHADVTDVRKLLTKIME